MAKVLSADQKYFREVWVEAAARPEGLVIECDSEKQARYVQMKLYKVAKPVRNNPGQDAIFAEAVMQLSIERVKDNPRAIRVYKAGFGGITALIAKTIGRDVIAEEKAEAKHAEADLLRRLGDLVEVEKPAGEAKRLDPYNLRGGD